MIVLTGSPIFKVKISITTISDSSVVEKWFYLTEKASASLPTSVADFSDCLSGDTDHTFALDKVVSATIQVDKEVVQVENADSIFDNFGNIYEQIEA